VALPQIRRGRPIGEVFAARFFAPSCARVHADSMIFSAADRVAPNCRTCP
jgi:hypothetical protein